MILIVAPYSPVSLSSKPHLGAARKIEMIVEALARVDSDIFFVNSAHNDLNVEVGIKRKNIGGVEVNHFSLKKSIFSKFGKFTSLFKVHEILGECLTFGVPRLVWIYNGYAFESLFSSAVKKRLNVPVVLEFEDWHFSRSRGINPKPFLDYFLWRKNLKNIDFSFGVNDRLVKLMSCHGVQGAILPGVVSERLVRLCDSRSVDVFSGAEVRIGYFGGLTKEKGVDVLSNAVGRLPPNYKVVISGAGDLENEISELSKSRPGKVEFHGRVSEHKLYELISGVDVIVNPHSPIDNMAEGIFPFKVVEAIASRKLLISTQLPPTSVPGLLNGVVFYDGTPESLVDSLIRSRALYQELKSSILSSSDVARENFSINALLRPIEKLMHESHIV